MNENVDRRTLRTQKMLQDAFFALVREKGYKAITIQDITQAANVGRTTFYLHYNSKEDLVFKWFAEIARESGIQLTSREEWLAPTPTPGTVRFFEKLRALDPLQEIIVTSGTDISLLTRGTDQVLVQKVETDLRQCFSDDELSVPLDLLAQSIAGLQSRLISCWVQKRPPSHTPQAFAEIAHRLMRAMVCEALQSPGK